MLTDENYGKIHIDTLKGYQLAVCKKNCCDYYSPEHAHKICRIDIKQLYNLMSENEYVIHCQEAIDKKMCSDTHGNSYGMVCRQPVTFSDVLLFYTNKGNYVVARLTTKFGSIVIGFEKTILHLDNVLNKLMIDLIKSMNTIEIFHYESCNMQQHTYFPPKAFEQGKHMFHSLIGTFKKYIDENIKLQHEFETQSTELKLELDTIKTKIKHFKSAIHEMAFDELDELFEIKITQPISHCDILSKKHAESEIHFEELAC